VPRGGEVAENQSLDFVALFYAIQMFIKSVPGSSTSLPHILKSTFNARDQEDDVGDLERHMPVIWDV
jgi:hypothetical protein